jgi:hypothetical protein
MTFDGVIINNLNLKIEKVNHAARTKSYLVVILTLEVISIIHQFLSLTFSIAEKVTIPLSGTRKKYASARWPDARPVPINRDFSAHRMPSILAFILASRGEVSCPLLVF